jgi:hypothetical protein
MMVLLEFTYSKDFRFGWVCAGGTLQTFAYDYLGPAGTFQTIITSIYKELDNA